MGEIADIVRGASPRPIKDPIWFNDESIIGWLRISDVTEQDGRIHFLEQRLSEAGQEKTRLLNEPHLLLSIAATVGKPVINYVQTGVHDGFLIFLNPKFDQEFMFQWLEMFRPQWQKFGQPGSQVNLNSDLVKNKDIMLPSGSEQIKIGNFFKNLDNLITLHQRKPFLQKKEVNSMPNEVYSAEIFCNYYAKWIDVYKNGAVRKVTMDKYLMTHRWLVRLVPDLRTEELDRIQYQQLLNEYAEYHEKQTVMDFHHQLKGAILDAVDEGLIERDPTRKAIIKGKSPRVKKIKYLNQFQLQILISSLELKEKINWDYFILLIAKTGMRFSEALALTPGDFDLRHQSVSISKTWDYKGNGGFLPTKNRSSVRKIQIDWQTVIQFSELIKGLPQDKPIFVDGKVYNSTVNDKVVRLCKQCKIPVISIHGLRHTHASLLLFTGVSIASVARRLGHSSINTTQKTYLHIIQELENKDVDLVMRLLAGFS